MRKPALTHHVRLLFGSTDSSSDRVLPQGQGQKLKSPEIENFAISAAEWSGTKGDFSTFLKKAAESRGFAFKKKRWRKHCGTLELRCYIDAGMRSTWNSQLPLVFEIEHKQATDLVFSTWLLEPLMPGFHYYHRHQSPEAAILGILAHVDLLDAIGELIAIASDWSP